MSIAKYKKLQSVCQFILIAILAIYFLTMIYTDIHITHYHSLSFLDCLFSGNLGGFYRANLEGSYMDCPAGYYIPIYIIFSIWDLPVWLLSRFGGIDPFSVGCLLWVKGLVLGFLLGCCYYIRKILQLLEDEDVEFGAFLFLSSMFVVIPAVSVAQYDVFSMFFVLWGIYRGAKENRLSVKTALIFSVAIPIKLFALFTYLIFLLLKEKRIIHIIKYLAIGMLGIVISIVPFLHDEGFRTATGFYSGNLYLSVAMFKVTIDGGVNGISPFFIGFFVVYIIAYIWEPDDTKDLLRRILWLGTFFYLAFFTFVGANPYWIVLIAPFVVLLTIQNSRYAKLSLILEIAMEGSIIVLQAYLYDWVYLSSGAFEWLVMKRVPEVSNLLGASSFADLLNSFKLQRVLPALYALFLVAGGALLWINFPTACSREKPDGDSYIGVETKAGIYFARLLCLMAYFALSVAIVYFV